MRLAATGAATLALALAIPTGATAAQRFAAPEGKGPEPCTQAAPCSLSNAVTKAKSNDEVIVTAGTYSVGGAIFPPETETNIYVHGDFAGPMPVITSALPGGVISIFGVKDRLSYLDVSNTGTSSGSAVACSFGGEVDRVRATAVGEQAAGIQVPGACVIRDSVAIAAGESAVGLKARGLAGGQTTLLRNVTALASGAKSSGVEAEFPGTPGTYNVDVANTIAGGSLADIAAYEGSEGAPKIVVSHSNFDLTVVGPEKKAAIVEGSGNQKAPPLFVNAAAGDLREAAGSPTIDAGIPDQLGALDLAGNPRVIGGFVDIGAYEFVPPIGELRSISFKPDTFRAANSGGAVLSRKKRHSAPVGSTVTYNLSAPATVAFSFERAVRGRRVGGKCQKATKANRSKRRCTFYRPIRGGFSVTGTAALDNRFKFSGRNGNRPLKPGTYKIVGRSGTTLKRGLFHIVK